MAQNLLQVSMDGPNVNLSFIQKLKTKMCSENPDGKALIETGVCGLHVLNGAVKSGLKASQWHLDQTLRDMYYLFKDSPARRAEYTAVTGSTDFPKKFCCVRWLENSECLERAIQIYDSVKKFTTESTLKSCPRQASLREQMQDPLLKCKLAAYKTIVSECEAFLRRFQSPKPLLPFLHTNLVGLIQSLLSRFVKPKKISGADTATKLLSLLFTEDTFLPFSRVDVGFGANKILQETKCSDKSKAEFKLQFQKFLVCLVKKLQERSPLKYKFVRGVTCFAPDLILNQANVAKIRADVVLHVLHSTNRISDDIAERVKKQYGLMCIEAQASFKSNFTAFISNHDDSVGLDEFYYNLLGNDGRFSDLFEVIKICLVLSHGNASVESGFSINKSILVENLLEQSVVSQRIVYDAINSVGGVSNVLISRRLLLSVRSSRKRYQDYLERRKLLESEEDKKLKDKRKIASELKALKEKKKKMRTEMNVQELALQEQIAELQHRHSNL